jgi:hypothetical protein
MPLTSPSLLTPFLTGIYPPWAGKQLLRDILIRLDGHTVDLADSIVVQLETEQIEVTTWADQRGYHRYTPGRSWATFDIEMFSGDWTLDTTLRARLASNQTVLTEVAPHQAAAGEGNPIWAANCEIVNYTPFQGQPGEAGVSHLLLQSTGDVTQS